MEEVTMRTLRGGVIVDRCVGCFGIWFDIGEAEKLKERPRSDAIDIGDATAGVRQNKLRDVDCPRCGKPMIALNDPRQKHIEYEACEAHGVYFDAGEFADYKSETLIDAFRDFVSTVRNR